MNKLNVSLAAMSAALMAMGAATGAQATVKIFDLTEYKSSSFGGATGSFGTVTVEDFTGSSNAKLENGNQLLFTITLNDGLFFQTGGKGAITDVFAFDLAGDPTLTPGSTGGSYKFYQPLDGAVGGGNTYAGTGFLNGAGGRGFAQVFDYAVQSTDGSPPPTLYAPTLQFRVTAGSALSLSSLTGHLVDGAGDGSPVTIFAAADISKGGLTGPVGAVERSVLPPIGGGVPEPAAWAMMIAGFGGVGAMMRRRRAVAA